MDYEKAACRDADPELFHPMPHARRSHPQVEQALQFCDGETRPNRPQRPACPIRTQCFQAALDGGESGIWGGTLDSEREQVRRTLAAIKARAKGQEVNQ